MPVVRNPQFYFREGFCWSDINTKLLKCRKKSKSVNDVKSMSLYGLTDKVPEFYIVSLINSIFMSRYVDDFVNNTQTFQINDARQLPIIIPTLKDLNFIKNNFHKAISLKKSVADGSATDSEIEQELMQIEEQLNNFIAKLYSV